MFARMPSGQQPGSDQWGADLHPEADGIDLACPVRECRRLRVWSGRQGGPAPGICPLARPRSLRTGIWGSPG